MAELTGDLIVEEELRVILQSYGGLSVPVDSLDENTDLFAAGLSSLATVNVMLAIEQKFGIEIPDELLTRRTFQTLASLRNTVGELCTGVAAA